MTTEPIVSQYTVNVVPATYVQHYLFAVTVDRCVQRDGTVLWAVRNGAWCLDRFGGSARDLTGSADPEWLADHRFDDLDEALRRAQAEAPHIEVNGITAEQVAARSGSRG